MDESIAALIDKYLSGKATAADEALLEAWYHRQIAGEIQWVASDFDEKQLLHDEMFEAIQKEIFFKEMKPVQPPYQKIRKRRPWLSVAAALALLAVLTTAAIYLMQRPSKNINIALSTQDISDSIVPGMNGAVLTLANGKKVVLDQSSVGSSLGSQGGTALKKAGDSLLVYQLGTGLNAAARVSYNTLETPKGRQFSVLLPDGSRVWLNAASSLKYPTAFAGKERLVELTGEAFFEVAHNASQPFKVKTHGQLIEDIGTRFNVNAYPDEKGVRTTLVEGAVQIRAEGDGKAFLLHPGQQAINIGRDIRVSSANLKKAVSWKSGYFEFEHESIQTVMRQIARWYNIEVVYASDVPDSYFTGDIDQNASIEQVLEVLSFAGTHFKVSGHTITIIP